MRYLRRLKLPEGQTVYEGTAVILGGLLAIAALTKLTGCDENVTHGSVLCKRTGAVGPREIGVSKTGNITISITSYSPYYSPSSPPGPSPSMSKTYIPIPAPIPLVQKYATFAECPSAEHRN